MAVGLELEGAWNRAPGNLKHDGSVVGDFGELAKGEVCSEPLATIESAEAWLRNNYPDRVNETCGFHVHVSLPPLYYSRLMVEDFNKKFLSQMEDFWNCYRGQPGFDQFRSRLDGQNQYCQKRFVPEAQLFRTEAYGDRAALPRYSQLNYCFGRHGTLECRLFPCFPSVDHCIAGMKVFTSCINNFLATTKPEKPIIVSIKVNESEVNHPVRLSSNI